MILTSRGLTFLNTPCVDDKAGAEHGAAARAYDCFSLRKHTPLSIRSVRLGHDEPYMREQDAPPQPSMPADIRNKVDAQRRLIATRRAQSSAQISKCRCVSLFDSCMFHIANFIDVGSTPLFPLIFPSVPVVPKNALSTWYSKRPRCHQITKDNYVSWHDHGMPHLLKFTAVFVCPLTGEIFPCGRHGSTESYQERTDSNASRVIWYSTSFAALLFVFCCEIEIYNALMTYLFATLIFYIDKKIMAEHAAAARAYDCWSFRLDGRRSAFLGEDQPYFSQKDAPPLPVFPPEKLVLVQELQRQASLRAPVSMEPAPMPTEQEILADRDEYRAARRAQDVSVLTMDESDDLCQ